MKTHYLKIALRNLLKYKTHSFISALCLSIGIVSFSLMYIFIHQINSYADLPHYDRRINFTLTSDQNSVYVPLYAEDIKRLNEQHIEGIDSLAVASYQEVAEINAIDKNQQEKPFIIHYKCVSSYFFSFYEMPLVYGNRVPAAPDEIVISEEFARKIGGNEDPLGITLHIAAAAGRPNNLIKDYKVVNVVKDTRKDLGLNADCYFPLEANPWAALTLSSYLKEGFELSQLQKQLELVTWERNQTNIHIQAYSIAQRDSERGNVIVQLMALLIISLILLSGLINFLKFIIQMFYNRQRELALRKCIGSDTKGLFVLLFSEVFWMMSFALLLSMVLTEVIISIAYAYIPKSDMPELSLSKVYLMHCLIYIVLLLLCLAVIWIPVYRLRNINIIHYITQNNRKHKFRNVMIALQLGISIFFLGGVLVITLSYNEMFGQMYRPLTSEEESHVLSLSVNSLRMKENMDAILSDISALPDVIDKTSLNLSSDINSFTYMGYKKADNSEVMLALTTGDPHYFSFFTIPMKGKDVGPKAEGEVYISEEFQSLLKKDNVEGMVKLDDKSYRIAGVYKALYKEYKRSSDMAGSVFLPNSTPSVYYFRISPAGDVKENIRKITDICRRYVPYTLPVDVRRLDDTKQTLNGSINMMGSAMAILALVSILLVVLSIYSAISMDTISRQKEVAIRKINGATPPVIAMIFGKPYLIIFLLTFLIVFPILRAAMIKLLGNSGVTYVYSWSWGSLLFISILFLLLLITGYKIYRIMHINPAEIIKNE